MQENSTSLTLRDQPKMSHYRFVFEHPSPDDGKKPSVFNVIAESEDAAWQGLTQQAERSREELEKFRPEIKVRELRPGEMILSQAPSMPTQIVQDHSLPDTDDPWAHIAWEGIRSITDTISSTTEGKRQNQFQLAIESMKLDRIILVVLSVAFLGSLAFSFFLISEDKTDPLFKFLFPIITSVLGLISGYLAGRGSAERSK